MIYTIGHTKSYEQYFLEQEQPQKTVGGYVWLNRNHAEYYKGKEYSVYGVAADWDDDTEFDENGYGWNRLLVNSDLINLNSPFLTNLYLMKKLVGHLGSVDKAVKWLWSKETGYYDKGIGRHISAAQAIKNGDVELVLHKVCSKFGLIYKDWDEE